MIKSYVMAKSETPYKCELFSCIFTNSDLVKRLLLSQVSGNVRTRRKIASLLVFLNNVLLLRIYDC